MHDFPAIVHSNRELVEYEGEAGILERKNIRSIPAPYIPAFFAQAKIAATLHYPLIHLPCETNHDAPS
jgi:hypothetical protein